MALVRRFYLYGVMLVALGVVAAGIATLVSFVVLSIEDSSGIPVRVSGTGDRLAIAVACLAVGLPVLLIHRARLPDPRREPDDCRDATRSTYVFVVLAASLFALYVALSVLVPFLALQALGGGYVDDSGFGGSGGVVSSPYWSSRAPSSPRRSSW